MGGEGIRGDGLGRGILRGLLGGRLVVLLGGLLGDDGMALLVVRVVRG